MLDKHYGDHDMYSATPDDLVSGRYLHNIPRDPITTVSDKAAESLFAGNQFRVAIGTCYRDHTTCPHSLQDLLKD